MDALERLRAESAEQRDRLVKRRAVLSAILKQPYSKAGKTAARQEEAAIAGKIEMLNWLDGRLVTLSIIHRKEKEDGE
jgi:hypothetical protein